MNPKQFVLKLFRKLVHSVPEGHEYYYGKWRGGTASYTYIPGSNGQGKTLDGDFQYKSTFGGGGYNKAEGHLYKGLKDGRWLFTHKGSTYRQLKVHFLGGRLSGQLAYSSKEESIGTLWKNTLTASLENDCVQGHVDGVLYGWQLSGFCDQQGLADGEWLLTWTERGGVETIRRELWDHGVLQSSSEEDLRKKKLLEKSVNIASQVNLLFDSEIRQLMKLMPEGTSTEHIRIIPE